MSYMLWNMVFFRHFLWIRVVILTFLLCSGTGSGFEMLSGTPPPKSGRTTLPRVIIIAGFMFHAQEQELSLATHRKVTKPSLLLTSEEAVNLENNDCGYGNNTTCSIVMT